MSTITAEVEEHIKDLKNRMKDTAYGEVGIVFTLRKGEVTLIKQVNQPLFRPGDRTGKR